MATPFPDRPPGPAPRGPHRAPSAARLSATWGHRPRRPVPGRPVAGASVPSPPPCSLDGLRPAALHSFQIAEEDFRIMENRRKSSRFPPEELTAGATGVRIRRPKQEYPMARMTAARAAVATLKREGGTDAFGVPGAAINPFYAALKASGGITHTLARHVEGASHMAEGYTRTRPGNIGVCIGTSGPAGTDMITGLYSATGDSVPILCITGQAPTAVIHKEDFQAVDIASIAAPVTKIAVTVLEAAQVPGVFQKAFHLMRSGRPGPVLIDLPRGGHQRDIEFDPDAYEPLPVYRPDVSRAQIEKALALLTAAERPLIVACGGVINAVAADLLVQFAELTGVTVVPTLMG